jgi:bifunctional non-homologous end joining protein LigD
MLATKAEEIFNNPDYLYEVKWDGFRIISFIKQRQIRLYSRKGENYTSRYPLVVNALKELKHDLVLDGEMVVFDEEGNPKFNAVQIYNKSTTPINYYLYDILYVDGYNVKALPLIDRQKILRELIKGNEILKISDPFEDGEGLYHLMEEKGWEGVVAKKKTSAYIENDRSNRWLKFPLKKTDEFVIGGWVESEKARAFRSILFGAYNDHGELVWLGRSGGGFKEGEMPGILKKLKKFTAKKSAFVNKVLDTKGAIVHWLKPVLVANFQYSEMTKSGRIRKPAIWKGFREDKDRGDVKIPVAKKFTEAVADKADDRVKANEKPSKKKSVPKKKRSSSRKYPYLNNDSGWEKVDEEQRGTEWQELEMKNCTIPIHDLERELWEGIPKGHLLTYYSEMGDYILPCLKDRPQSLNLKLTHAGAPRTFIKDMENRQPACAEVFVDRRIHSKEGKRDQIDYLICNNLETLIYMADVGCVDINPWASRTHSINEPDYLTIDLDPTIPNKLTVKQRLKAEGEGFAKAIEVAITAKKIFDEYQLKTFIKTSGQTGLHIYIPCSGFTYKVPREIAFKLAKEVQASVSKISTLQSSKDLRGDKVYIDTTLNDYADTLAAPYCIRPYHEPLVSTPLDWSEIKKGLNRYEFTMETIQARLVKKGDLWENLSDKRIIRKNNEALSHS